MPKIKRFTAAGTARLRLPPGKTQIDFFENLHPGRSLILTINKGRRSWFALFYDRGRPRRAKLGEYPGMAIKDARRAAIEFDAGRALAGARSGTFADVVGRYLERDVAKRGLVSASEIRRLLHSHAVPRWAARPFADIRRRDVADLLDDVERAHGAGVADSLLAVLTRLMNWQVTRDDDYTSPVVRGMKRRPAVKRHRWLSDDEIARLWASTDDGDTFADICRVLLLTGQRRQKVRALLWSDVDLDSGEWRIPRAPREKGTPPAITLPTMALDVIRARPRFAENPFVFAGRGTTAFDNFSHGKIRLDARLGFAEPWRLHDLRRTARALMTRARVPTEIAELVLGHAIPGVQSHYDDPREYRRRVDDALRAVEREVVKILEPGAKVVALRT